MCTCQGIVRDHLGQHFDSIVLNDAQVADIAFANEFQQRTHAGCMYFNADEIFVAEHFCDGGGGFTHAKTDLDN